MRHPHSRRQLPRTLTMLALAAVAACSSSATPSGPSDPNDPLGQSGDSLTALATQCTFNPATGVMTVAFTSVAGGETAIISMRAADSAILQNGYGCLSTVAPNPPILATATTLKKIAVVGTAVADHLVLDFTNGLFAMGTSSTALLGSITGDMLAGANTIGIKGTALVDTVTFGAAEKILMNPDAYTDVAMAATGGTDAYTVSLGDGNDVWSASGAPGAPGAAALAVKVYGGNGNDTFNEGAAITLSETISGGAGTDTVNYASRVNALTMILGDATATDGEASELDDLADDIEVVNGGSGDDTFSGTLLAHTYNGNAGNDTMAGTAAIDGPGTFNGGAGTDTASYALRSAAVIAVLDGVTHSGELTENDILGADVENLTGGTLGDTLTGNALNNVIKGGLGADTMYGLAGDDRFDEGAAPSGADVISGGTGSDTIDYSARVAIITATLDGTATSGGAAETDTLGVACVPAVTGCFDVENLWGGTLADVLTGNSSANELVGGTGNDTLSGGAGDDVIEGGGLAESNIIDCGAGDGDIGYGKGSGGGSMVNCEF